MASVLETKDLYRSFGDFVAVNKVNLEVAEGSFFSILGPSGCGKTTLLRMIAGFLEPTSGVLNIRGESMIGVPPNKRPVNLVFQNLALFPMMNVAENIAFGLERQKKSKKEIAYKTDAILERIHLSGYGDKRVDQLSGGQKQRVAIARSLVLDPSILLLDEPLGALDLKLREQMKIELKKLQAEVGTTFIYITHDQSEALVMSDRVAVMNKGQFEQVDSPRNLYENPTTSFVAGFVGENNKFDAKVVENKGEHCTVQIGNGLQFKTRIQGNSGAQTGDFFMRPEAIMIYPESAQENLNYFKIKVTNILFDGANTKLLGNIGEGDVEVSVALPQNSRFAGIAKGDVVDAAVHADACRFFA